MEFAEAKLDEALAAANTSSDTPDNRVVGDAAKQGVLQHLERNEDLLRNVYCYGSTITRRTTSPSSHC